MSWTDKASIRHGLAGNLCRCTGYRAIVDAVRDLVRGERRMSVISPPGIGARSAPQVGRSMARVDAAEKLRGEAQFVGDLVVPRMLHGKVLRSPYAHARIRSIDFDRGAGDPLGSWPS